MNDQYTYIKTFFIQNLGYTVINIQYWFLLLFENFSRAVFGAT